MFSLGAALYIEGPPITFGIDTNTAIQHSVFTNNVADAQNTGSIFFITGSTKL